MLYLMRKQEIQAAGGKGEEFDPRDEEQALGRRHMLIAGGHLGLVLILAWSVVLSCL